MNPIDQASQWMRILGALALLTPFIVTRIPRFRPYGRIVGLSLTLLYLAVGVCFVLWYTLIRSAPQ